MINQPVRLTCMQVFLACFVAGALASATPTKADVLYLRKSPDLEEVVARLTEELSPAPLLEIERGKFFYGTVLAYRRGTHGNWQDKDSHDSILFLAHGRGGANPSRNPAEISVSVIDWLVHEYDAPNDFVFHFSNRHELLDTPFGSPLHRASLFRIFNPLDPRAMPGNSDADVEGAVDEGTVTRVLMSGPPTMEEMPMASWSMHAPDFLFPGHYADSDETGRFAHVWPHGTSALLLAMARASEYPAFDQEVGKMAREAAGLMCSMALRDSDVPISPAMQIRARRAWFYGTKCFSDITMALEINREGFGYINASPRTGIVVMPVSLSNYVLAAIDLIESQPFFSRYINPAQSLHDGQVYSPSRSNFRGDSGYIIHALADLAGGFSEASQSPDVRRAAERALVRMITPGPDETREERRKNELSRRNFRAQIMGWADKYVTSAGESSNRPLDPRAENWLMSLYCRVGWGNHLDITAFARGRIGMATAYLSDFDGGAPRPELAADGERYIRQVGLMQRTALSGGRTGMFLREAIENEVTLIRAHESTENKRFIRIYDDYMSEELNCDGYQPGGR